MLHIQDLTLSELQAAHEERVEDIAVLVQRLEGRREALEAALGKLEADKAGLESGLNEARSRCSRLEADLKKTRALCTALTRERDALLASTSWKITGPLRAMKIALTRRKAVRTPPEKATGTW